MTKENVCALFKQLFDLKRDQRDKHGEDGEILEYMKSQFMVTLPEPSVIVPRAKPVPKEKPQTKWERFREERGLPARQKRSRMIFDPITKDWVPRWGPNSQKKIVEKHEWLIEDNSGKEGGVNPFTKKKQEKKLGVEKEKMKMLKNEMYAMKQAKGKKNNGEE